MEDTRPRVWYVIGNLSVGGAERTLLELVNGLDLDQFDVSLWTIEDKNPLAEELPNSITLRSLNAKSKLDVRAPLKFFRAVRQEQPDIIHSFLFYDNLLAILGGNLNNNTTVITGVRTVPNDPTFIRSSVRGFVHSRADHVVSNSESGVDFITEHGVNPQKVSVIRNGRDISRYRSGKATPELLDSLGIQREHPVVGTVGRLIERKGHYDLLEAWPTVLESKPEAQLLFVGDGPERDGLEAKVQNLGCGDSVVFAGQRDNVPDLLDAMDVFVFPSHYEGLPGALMEAMIAGLPIVATPVDGNSELIDDGKTGLFVPPHDSDAIANQLVELLDDSGRQEKLGSTAAAYAREEFTIERMVSEFEDLYAQVTEPR
ncbi:glycosyltransferase [Halalkaliarchaeum sp. AArc-GB]|uniref:glycosyltransferase n=1 Tax=Halalkaliarchaeum sp. AArc-GB TaxID=3074078 RepID=UPI00285BD909|nr:glycosyltransferase [Halalkaliarchaeum sp. AArc-GB]MDR5674213.1 glycosyltransferase [Halalkaliarchaeum sp. AArc-GB]